MASMPKTRENDLLFAVPKKGRLYERCVRLLETAGFKFERVSRLDIASCSNMPVTLVFLPAADIAKYVGQGNVDMGITGLDIIGESNVDVKTILQLGFGQCRLALQAPVAKNIKSAADLAGGRVVTSFPTLTQKFFERVCPDNMPSINTVSGSVEVACSLGLADAVVDLVETGTTMRAAGLDIVDVVMTTEAVLIGNPKAAHKELVERISERIRGTVNASKFAYITYNVPRALLPDAMKVTPGKRSPTVSPLEESDWVAVSALVPKARIHEIMDELQAIGAVDILVFDMANCRV